jgi:DNA-binding transcriptional regulator YdaS (Cro superfamily)
MMTLKEYLQKSKLTQSQFARIAGIHKTIVWHHISGRNLSLENAMKILEATQGEVGLSDLSANNGSPTPPAGGPEPDNGGHISTS